MRRSCPVPFPHDSNLQGRGDAAQLPHVFFFFFFLGLQAPIAPWPHTALPARKNSRLPTNGLNLPLVSVFYYYWMMPWLRAQNGLCYFHSATVHRELLIGSWCSHGNARGSICALRGHAAGLCTANRKVPLYLLSAVVTHKISDLSYEMLCLKSTS